MISYQLEPYNECIAELATHLEAHYKEIALDQDAVPLDVDWAVYQQLADQGQMHMVTARKASELVGYIVGFVRPHCHYRSTLHVFTDVFWLRPDCRQGFAGIKLFKEYERTLKQRGVVKAFIASKVYLDMSAIFERLGWRKTETVYSKLL